MSFSLHIILFYDSYESNNEIFPSISNHITNSAINTTKFNFPNHLKSIINNSNITDTNTLHSNHLEVNNHKNDSQFIDLNLFKSDNFTITLESFKKCIFAKNKTQICFIGDNNQFISSKMLGYGQKSVIFSVYIGINHDIDRNDIKSIWAMKFVRTSSLCIQLKIEYDFLMEIGYNSYMSQLHPEFPYISWHSFSNKIPVMRCMIALSYFKNSQQLKTKIEYQQTHEMKSDRNNDIIDIIFTCYSNILYALESMSKLNYFHLDLHAGNILFDQITHTCYLIDFGYVMQINNSVTPWHGISNQYSSIAWNHLISKIERSKIKDIKILIHYGNYQNEYALSSIMFHWFVSIYAKNEFKSKYLQRNNNIALKLKRLENVIDCIEHKVAYEFQEIDEYLQKKRYIFQDYLFPTWCLREKQLELLNNIKFYKNMHVNRFWTMLTVLNFQHASGTLCNDTQIIINSLSKTQCRL